MATLLGTPHFGAAASSSSLTVSPKSFNSPLFLKTQTSIKCFTTIITHTPPPPAPASLFAHFFPSNNKTSFFVLASSGEATETQQQQPPEIQDDTDETLNGENAEEAVSDEAKPNADETPTSPVIATLQLYKEALSNNDESKVAELEAFFKSIEDEKDALERKVTMMSEDLSVERDRVLRISADFDNYRKRTDRERTSLVTNAQGEVVENFLPVLDNFERAKSQIKIESEAEEKINNSYQSIYKQFVEILGSIGVVPVETVGNPFDPLLHEAIMREESVVYDDGIIIEEYRKGFKLGDRLLRPSMVKVSAGPGPEKPEVTESSIQEEGVTKDVEDVAEEADS